MLGMLKAEFYKLFTKKSFYVCALILMVIAGANVWGTESLLCARWGIESLDLKRLGYTGWSVFNVGIDNLPIFCSIFSSIFVCSEFSSGMTKSLVIRGKSRIVIYLSKLISSMVVPVVYSLLTIATAYSVGSYLWGAGTWSDKYVNSLLIPMGMFILLQMIYQSMFVMFGYVFMSSGWTTAINFGTASGLIPGLIAAGISYVATNWFGVSRSVAYSITDYWIGNYGSIHAEEWPYEQDVLNKIIWVMVAYLVIPTIIGVVVFCKREVK